MSAGGINAWNYPCLLYTSDAADERSSVDLGGRRIIKKKTNTEQSVTRRSHQNTEHTTPIHNRHMTLT